MIKFSHILNEAWWWEEKANKLYAPDDLTFYSRQTAEDTVNYDIYITDTNKKIGTYVFWAVGDYILLDRENFKVPTKDYMLKMMGILPNLINDYVNNGLYPEDDMPKEFKLDLDNAITRQRFHDDYYGRYINSKFDHRYRVVFQSDAIRIYLRA